MECSRLSLVTLCLVLSSLPTALALFRKHTRLSRMPMYYGKRSETGSRPGQHDLGILGHHDLGTLGQHDLRTPDQHDLGTTGQHDLGTLGLHDLGTTGQHYLAGDPPQSYRDFFLSKFSRVFGNVKVSPPRDHRLDDVITNRHRRLVDNRHVFPLTGTSENSGTKPDTVNTQLVLRVRRTSKFANDAGKRRSSVLSRMPAYFGKRNTGIPFQDKLEGKVPENMFKFTSHDTSSFNRFAAIDGHKQMNDLKQHSDTTNEIKKRINDFDIKE